MIISSRSKRTVRIMSKENYEIALLVRSELNMSIGKIAAQVGHAVHRLVQKEYDCREKKDPRPNFFFRALSVGSYAELLEVRRAARAVGVGSSDEKILTATVQDAGHTEVAPGTVTVLGLLGTRAALDIFGEYDEQVNDPRVVWE